DQPRRARAREQIATGIGRMAHADMAERIEHAFVRQYAVGNRDLVAGIGEVIGHGRFLLSGGQLYAAGAKPKWPPLPSRPGAARASCGDAGSSLSGCAGARAKTALPRRRDVSRLRAAPPPNRRTTP